jgi:hypothetical protein
MINHVVPIGNQFAIRAEILEAHPTRGLDR